MRYKHIVTLVSAMLFVSSFCFGCKYTEALPMNGKNTVSSNSSKNITASNASTVSNSLGSTVKKNDFSVFSSSSKKQNTSSPKSPSSHISANTETISDISSATADHSTPNFTHQYFSRIILESEQRIDSAYSYIAATSDGGFVALRNQYQENKEKNYIVDIYNQSKQLVSSKEIYSDAISYFGVDKNNNWISADYTGKIQIYNKTGNPIKAIQTNDERIYSLAILTNGNIVYIGTHYQDPDDIYSNFVSIAVMTPSGQLIARKSYANADCSQVIATDDGGFAVVGIASFSQSSANAELQKIFNSCSYGKQDVFLAKYSANHQLEWVSAFGGSHYEDMPHFTQASNGDFYLTCTTISTDFSDSALNSRAGYAANILIRFDRYGKQLYAIPLAYCGGSAYSIFAIHPKSDGTVTVIGSSRTQDTLLSAYPIDFDFDTPYGNGNSENTCLVAYVASFSNTGKRIKTNLYLCNLESMPSSYAIMMDSTIILAGRYTDSTRLFPITNPYGYRILPVLSFIKY